MWWNNVETKPGTGYPTKWEDQEIYKGGWVKEKDGIELKSGGVKKGLGNMFHNPNMPTMDDYYEPWTYDYENLFNKNEGKDQPTARPISLITGEPMDIKGGPNWDDDLSGTPDYARQDINLEGLSPQEKEAMFQLERMTMHYLPRMCNHCSNPACVAACPSGAVYKRGEDGIVLVNQEKCRAWRMCVSSCPYKKVYYNWNTGKSEKCILCFPRIETGQAPACMHTCVGRIRYLGVMLYDASKIQELASVPVDELVEAQKSMYLNPFDPEVISAAIKNGVSESTIDAAQKSPVWKFVKEWEIALPLHPEFRTMPNLFYVPPLLPTMSTVDENKIYEKGSNDFWGSVESSRLPVQYLANMFSAGNTAVISNVLKKLMAVRVHRRTETVKGEKNTISDEMLASLNMTKEVADSMYRLTSLAKFSERFVIPAAHREEAIEMIESTSDVKGSTGFGFTLKPERGL